MFVLNCVGLAERQSGYEYLQGKQTVKSLLSPSKASIALAEAINDQWNMR